MNERKSMKSSSSKRMTKPPQRRVSFSKVSKPSKYPQTPSSFPLPGCPVHGSATDNSCSLPRVVSLSRPSKSSLKLRPSNSKSIGVCAKSKKRDVSSTTADPRPTSRVDPSASHLKYGTFRSLSKLRKQSEDSGPPAQSSRRECRPIQVARSSVAKRPMNPRQSFVKANTTPPAPPAPPLPPPLPATRHVLLSRVGPTHLDIKPKKFPSMLWC